MKHIRTVTQIPATAVTTTGGLPLLIKLNGVVAIVDDLLLAQRQTPWKVHFGDTTTTTTPTIPTF